MSVKLRKRANKDGSTSLVLDIYHEGKRSYEFLSQLKLPAGSSPVDRQAKKENLELAKKIAIARAQELQANDYNVATDHAKNVIVIQWMNAYAKSYAKADVRVITSVINNFSRFLAEKKLSGLVMKDFSESIAQQFRDRLKEDCIGEGAKSYYNRFRKVVKQAYRDKLLQRNPCEFVKPPTGQAAEKDILTPEELQLLANTLTQAPEVKRAYLFCCLTGLRFCDVKALTWGALNIEERKMKLQQLKTDKEVKVPLNSSAINILGEVGKVGDLVFQLGSANGCNKSLQAMVDRAKIKKKITWHTGRHYCGTTLTRTGSGLMTVMHVLGQSSLQMAKRYVKASEEMNQVAVDNLPAIIL